LYIKCPKTDKDVFTGMDVPKEMDRSGFRDNRVHCPHCADVHSWNGEDAYFLDDNSPRNGAPRHP
jgi:hypothetical protein